MPSQTPTPPNHPPQDIAHGLQFSTVYSGLDTEDNDPINVPDNKHKQKYTGRDTYLSHFAEARSVNSSFGIKGDEIQERNVFKKTNLDLENPEITGGPINVPPQRKATGFSQPNTPTNPYIKDGLPWDPSTMEREGDWTSNILPF